MRRFDKLYTLIFNVDDKWTEDASRMMDQQKNKAACIRTILLDFAKVNNIIRDYTKIPKKERLERFFGYSGYSEKDAGTLQPDKREGKRQCRCQFRFNPYHCNPSKAANDVFVMLDFSDNVSLLIRELFLDFVTANGVIENYTSIPENERLKMFFGYTARAVVPAKQSGRTVRILQDKTIEVQQCYEGTRYVSTYISYKTPDGKKVCFTV